MPAKTTTRPIPALPASARPWVAAQRALKWACPFCDETNARTIGNPDTAPDVDPGRCRGCGAVPSCDYSTATKEAR